MHRPNFGPVDHPPSDWFPWDRSLSSRSPPPTRFCCIVVLCPPHRVWPPAHPAGLESPPPPQLRPRRRGTTSLSSLAAHPSRLQHDLLWVPTSLSLTICNLTACLQQQSLARRRRSSLVATKNAVGGSKTKSPVPAKHTNTSRRRYRHSSKILDGSSKN